jgi:hypothetical protein
MRTVATAFCLSVAGIVLGAVGCNGGVDFTAGLDTPASAADLDGGGGASAVSTCGDDAAPPERLADPSTLPACAPACGGAHCVPADKVPEVSRPFFAACGGGYCLPDPIIASGGARPPSCKSLNNADGVCLSLCVPQVSLNKDVLPQATCANDERCTPCINPNDNTATGACAIGSQLPTSTGPCSSPDAGAVVLEAAAPPDITCPHVGPPVVDPMKLPACGGPKSGGAHCLPGHLVPPALAPKLVTCSGGFCVPDKIIAAGGRYIPATCTSIIGSEGRCLNTVIPLVSAQTGIPVSTCDANERCVPCLSPVDGSDTGACKTSCDPGPTRPAKRFDDCCDQNGATRGKCIPKTSVPAAYSPNLQTDTCDPQSFCVPTENIPTAFVPPPCSASAFLSGPYTGVCLSNCLQFGAGSDLATAQGNCKALHTCIPCVRDGAPTGAPGCPP